MDLGHPALTAPLLPGLQRRFKSRAVGDSIPLILSQQKHDALGVKSTEKRWPRALAAGGGQEAGGDPDLDTTESHRAASTGPLPVPTLTDMPSKPTVLVRAAPSLCGSTDPRLRSSEGLGCALPTRHSQHHHSHHLQRGLQDGPAGKQHHGQISWGRGWRQGWLRSAGERGGSALALTLYPSPSTRTAHLILKRLRAWRLRSKALPTVSLGTTVPTHLRGPATLWSCS